MTTNAAHVGRSPTVLVFGRGASKVAVVSTIEARVKGCHSPIDHRLSYCGPVTFDDDTARHMADTVLPLVDRVIEPLGLGQRAYELSVANVGAASIHDVGMCVSGFSVDLPVLLAILSVAMALPNPQDTLSTGHIASVSGEIRPVRSLAQKLEVATQTPDIQSVILPALTTDVSMLHLSPREQKHVGDAVIQAAQSLRIVEVVTIDQVLPVVWPQEAVVLSSLRTGFFETGSPSDSSDDPIGRAVGFLKNDNEGRFWSAMQRQILTGYASDAHRLMEARIQYHISREQYPPDLGRRLRLLIQSLPPAVRRVRTVYPLAPLEQCIRLGQFIGSGDDSGIEDFRELINTVSGGTAHSLRSTHDPSVAAAADPPPITEQAGIESILSEISDETLSTTIGLPIDNARARYVLDKVIVDSYEEFLDVIDAFYRHLLLHLDTVPAMAGDIEVADEASALVKRAFDDKGGLEAAAAEAINGIHGGLRFILDVMTEQFKSDKQAKHVDRILHHAIDLLDWDDRVQLMAALMARIGPLLPESLRDLPPQRFARKVDAIAKAYVRSIDRVKQLLQTL